jgi:PDZ domain-containing secreted protein
LVRRPRYAAPPLLALALLLLFLLIPQQSSGKGQLLEIQQLVQVPGTGEPNRITLKV